MSTEKPEKEAPKDAKTSMTEKTPEELRKVAAGVPTPYHRMSTDPEMPASSTND